MKLVIIGAILTVVLFVIGVAVKAIKSSAIYLDESFRWGGRDG